MTAEAKAMIAKITPLEALGQSGKFDNELAEYLRAHEELKSGHLTQKRYALIRGSLIRSVATTTELCTESIRRILFGLSEEERHQDRHIRDDTAMIFAEGIGVEFHSIRFIDGLVKPNTGSVPLVSSSRGPVIKQVEQLVCENCFMVYNPAFPGSCLCG